MSERQEKENGEAFEEIMATTLSQSTRQNKLEINEKNKDTLISS